jgi:hypothetical protein
MIDRGREGHGDFPTAAERAIGKPHRSAIVARVEHRWAQFPKVSSTSKRAIILRTKGVGDAECSRNRTPNPDRPPIRMMRRWTFPTRVFVGL